MNFPGRVEPRQPRRQIEPWYILSQCAQHTYLIKLLQHKGMPQHQLSVVIYSITVSRILYALPAWGDFLTAELIGKINAFFRHVKQFGYYIDTVHHLLPPYCSSNLRGHSFHLPDYDTMLFKKSFIVCSLYKFVASNY